jgi:hypothetical protein
MPCLATFPQQVAAIFTGNVDAGNVRTTGIVTATGNVSTAGFFVGDGGFISNITVAASTKIVNGTSYANIAASEWQSWS